MVVSARCDKNDVIARVDADAAPYNYSMNTENWGAGLVLAPTHMCGQQKVLRSGVVRPYVTPVVSTHRDTRVNVDAVPFSTIPTSHRYILSEGRYTICANTRR